MKQLLNSILSERIKTRNSAVSWLTIAGAIFIPFIILVSRLVQHNQTLMMNATQGIWMKLFNKHWQFMATFLLPMGIILASSIITQIEYRNNTWKQLYTSPQKLSTIFWSKYIIVFSVLIQFFLLFNIGIYLSGALPALFFKDVIYPSESFPIRDYFFGNCAYLIYCLPIIALQYLLSLHIRNFVVSIGIGLALVIAALIGVNNQYGYVIPYIYGAMKFLVADNRIDPNINTTYWAIGYFIFFSWANYLIFICKTQTTASKYFTLKKLLILLSILLTILISIGIVKSTKTNKPLSDNYPKQIQHNIVAFEQNLGAFNIEGNKEWSLVERMKFYKVKGMSIAVIKNYKIEWAKGYGYADVESKIPVTKNTIFQPGSISKSINALALMKLVQEHKVNLFEDINSHLTSWKFPYNTKSNGKKITLANLLSHTAGLNVHGFEGYKFGDSLPTIYQILDGKFPANSLPVRSIFEPNKKMEYSGGGILISQLMLMDITKQSYDKYLAQNIFKVLDMNNSFYTQPIPTNKREFAATGYDSLGKALKGKYPIMVEQAAAGLWTTATDLAKFITEIQLSLKRKSNKIVSQQYTELMLTPYLNDTTTLGFFKADMQGHQYFGHDAGNYGFSGSFTGSIENGNGVAILINSENSGILNEIRNTIIDVYNWGGFPKKEIKKLAKIDNTILDNYIGIYEAKAEERKVEIRKENNTYYSLTNNEKRKMYFTSNTEFVNMENQALKTFIVNRNKVVTGFTLKYNDKQISFTKTK